MTKLTTLLVLVHVNRSYRHIQRTLIWQKKVNSVRSHQFGTRIIHIWNTVYRKIKYTATFAVFFGEVWDEKRAIQHGLQELMIGRK